MSEQDQDNFEKGPPNDFMPGEDEFDDDLEAGDEGEAVHFRCSRQHHHHLVCRSRVRH